jgi:hypothetical protein
VTFNRVLSAGNADATGAMDTANKVYASQALILQSYMLSVLKQPKVDFGSLANLKPLEGNINGSLDRAVTNANWYLDQLLPDAIQTIANINAYFNLQNALVTALQPGADARTTISLLKTVQDKASAYQSQAATVVGDLGRLRTALSQDSAAFNGFVTQLNTAVGGDTGVLQSVSQQLDSVDSKISGAVAGTVVSGLVIAGGIFVICVGGIAGFVTAGTSTPLVLLGVGIVVGGVAGEVASAVTLSNLMKLKADLLAQQSQLKAEVNLALGLQSGFQGLASAAGDAAAASQQMANAWGSLDDHLGNLIDNVQSGQTDAAALRTLFQTAAQGDVKNIQSDVTTIQNQLAGVQQVSGGNDVATAIVQAAKNAAPKVA